MGLARALTKRFVRPSTPEETTKQRPTISMPMGLISTTNQSVHNYPTIATSQTVAVQQRQFNTSSGSSLNESDDNGSSSPDTPGMTDASSVESYSPIEPNHLTQYFPTPSKKSSRSPVVSILEPSPTYVEPELQSPQAELEQQPLQAEPEAKQPTVSNVEPVASEQESTLSPIPDLPARAPSHSKRAHERLARVRSFRSLRSSTGPSTGVSSVRESATEDTLVDDRPIAPLRASGRPASDAVAMSLSAASLSETSPQSTFNPFSAELIQLDEVAEEFHTYSSELTWEQECEEDFRVMREKGLRPHRASEYLRDISVLRTALWDLVEEKEKEKEAADTDINDDDEDENEEFHDASDWI